MTKILWRLFNRSDQALDSPLVALSVHRRLDQIEKESYESRSGFRDTHDEFRRTLSELGHEIQEVRGIANEVKRLQGETNGRLREVERVQERIKGAKDALHWVPTLGCSILGGTIVGLIVKFA